MTHSTVDPRRRGLALAGLAACISGVAVFVNSYGVKQYGNATAYTTAKNAIAALAIAAVVVVGGRRRARPGTAIERATEDPLPRRRTAFGVVVIAVIGGSVPFVLFFEGLARASAKDAAFLQKTMVVWVAILATVVLKERLGWGHVAAIAALIVGQALLGVRFDTLRPGGGELMILVATLLWSVEVVVAKRLLAGLDARVLALARMGLGSVLLLVWLGLTGQLRDVVPSSTGAALWLLATGVILGAYVLTWYASLARAGAIDVTAMLVFAVVITAFLDDAFKGVALAPQWAGLVTITCGCIAFALVSATLRRPRPVAVGAPEAVTNR